MVFNKYRHQHQQVEKTNAERLAKRQFDFKDDLQDNPDFTEDGINDAVTTIYPGLIDGGGIATATDVVSLLIDTKEPSATKPSISIATTLRPRPATSIGALETPSVNFQVDIPTIFTGVAKATSTHNSHLSAAKTSSRAVHQNSAATTGYQFVHSTVSSSAIYNASILPTASSANFQAGISTGALTAIVIVIVAFVSVCVGLIPFALRRRRHKQISEKEDTFVMTKEKKSPSDPPRSRFSSLTNINTKDFDAKISSGSSAKLYTEGTKVHVRQQSEASASTRGETLAVVNSAWSPEWNTNEIIYDPATHSIDAYVDHRPLPRRSSSLNQDGTSEKNIPLPELPSRPAPLNLSKVQPGFPYEMFQPTPQMGNIFSAKSASSSHLPIIPNSETEDGLSPPPTPSKRNSRLRSQTLSAVGGKRESMLGQSGPQNRDSSYGVSLSLFPPLKSPPVSDINSPPLSYPLISNPPTIALPPVPDIKGLGKQNFVLLRKASNASTRSENPDRAKPVLERQRLEKEYAVLHKRMSTPVVTDHLGPIFGPRMVKHRPLSSVEFTNSTILEATASFEHKEEMKMNENRMSVANNRLTLQFAKSLPLMPNFTAPTTPVKSANNNNIGNRSSLLPRVTSMQPDHAFNFFSSPTDGTRDSFTVDSPLNPFDIAFDEESSHVIEESAEGPSHNRIRSSLYSRATNTRTSRMDSDDMSTVSDVMLRPRPKTLTIGGSLPLDKCSTDNQGQGFRFSTVNEEEQPIAPRTVGSRSSGVQAIAVHHDMQGDNWDMKREKRGGAVFSGSNSPAKSDNDSTLEKGILRARSGNIVTARSLRVRQSRPEEKKIELDVNVHANQLTAEHEPSNDITLMPPLDRTSNLYGTESTYSSTMSVLNFYSRYSATPGSGNSTPSMMLDQFSEETHLPELPQNVFAQRPSSSPSTLAISPLSFATTQPYFHSFGSRSTSDNTEIQDISQEDHNNTESETILSSLIPAAPAIRQNPFGRSTSHCSQSTISGHNRDTSTSQHEVDQSSSGSQQLSSPSCPAKLLTRHAGLNLNLGHHDHFSFHAGDDLESGF